MASREPYQHQDNHRSDRSGHQRTTSLFPTLDIVGMDAKNAKRFVAESAASSDLASLSSFSVMI
jgi:hypothetical protein